MGNTEMKWCSDMMRLVMVWGWAAADCVLFSVGLWRCCERCESVYD